MADGSAPSRDGLAAITTADCRVPAADVAPRNDARGNSNTPAPPSQAQRSISGSLKGEAARSIPIQGQADAPHPDDGIRRTGSITFHTHVKTDTGEHQVLKEAPPVTERSIRVRGRSLIDEIAAEKSARSASKEAASDEQSSPPQPTDTEATTARRRSRRDRRVYRVGEGRFPLLQTTVDEMALDDGNASDRQGPSPARSPSLGSARSGSFEFMYGSSSVDTLASPVDYPFPQLPESGYGIAGTASPNRSFSFVLDRNGNPRRQSTKRSNGRTVSTASMSPANAFLTSWSRDDPSKIEPDDEGQEIGDNNQYVIGRQIGFGGFSTVKEVFSMEGTDRIRQAVKIVRKQVAGASEQENERVQTDFDHEVFIWRLLQHPNILPLVDVYETPFATYCITKLNAGGTLFDLVRKLRRRHTLSPTFALLSSRSGTGETAQQTVQKLSLSLAKRYIWQVASAIRYLHQDVRIVHRDIKLENCLLDVAASPDGDEAGGGWPEQAPSGNVLVCDFGMANFIDDEDRDVPIQMASHGHHPNIAPPNIGPSKTSTNVAGSLAYASPELIEATTQLYEPSVDIWAFGVLCFALLTGDLPFRHSLLPKLQDMILKGEWSQDALKEAVFKNESNSSTSMSREASDALCLVASCLEPDHRKRWDISQVLQCDFLQEVAVSAESSA